MQGAAAVIADEIRAKGPIGFERYMELALYHPTGFYASGGRAGRRGDFLTSPEVGPLFGAVLARAIDRWWDELGRPEPWVVIEAGAGPGTLAASVLAAHPDCAPALRYVLVERSEAQRRRHGDHLDLISPSQSFMGGDQPDDEPARAPAGPHVISLVELPRVGITGVVVANELLDNLPTRLMERGDDGWNLLLVGLGDDPPAFVEVLVPAPAELAQLGDRLAPDARPGARIPIQALAGAWLRDALAVVERGRVVVLDYGDDTASLASRSPGDWLRTYRDHERGGRPLDMVGEQDITCEVAVDQLARIRVPTRRSTQAELLRAHGIDELVEEGRRTWEQRAGVGDLDALRARSRVREAEALVDPAGLGAFVALEWVR